MADLKDMIRGAAGDELGGTALGAATGPLGAALSTITDGIRSFVAGLAIATAALFAMAQFVKAINPSQALLFNQALKDLSATIGSGLVPVIAIFTDFINRISGTLLPIMQQLSPLFAELANTIANNLLALFQALAGVFVEFIPVIKVIIDLYQKYSEIWRVVIRVVISLVQAIITVIGSLLGVKMDDVQSGIKAFADALRNLVVHITLAAAAILNWVGMSELVREWQSRISAMLGGGPLRGARSVDAINPQMSNIAQVGNAIALSAAGAMAGGPGMKEDESLKALKEISDGMDKIVQGKESLSDTIAKALVAGLQTQEVAQMMAGFAVDVGKEVALRIARAPISVAGSVLGIGTNSR